MTAAWGDVHAEKAKTMLASPDARSMPLIERAGVLLKTLLEAEKALADIMHDYADPDPGEDSTRAMPSGLTATLDEAGHIAERVLRRSSEIQQRVGRL